VPAGPVAPVVPAGPVAPVVPAGPVAPVAPVVPAGPVAPVVPAGPVAPVVPAGPCGPWAPFPAAQQLLQSYDAGLNTEPVFFASGKNIFDFFFNLFLENHFNICLPCLQTNKKMERIIECPHCFAYIMIEQMNCKIFVCAVYKSTGTPVNPHISKADIDHLLATDQVYGCGGSFELQTNFDVPTKCPNGT
jgi:hypothetical protein